MSKRPPASPERSPLAAVYTRVSSKPQSISKDEGRDLDPETGKQETSLETQETACREHAHALGLRVSEAHVVQEVGSAAVLFERRKLMALIDAAERREIDAIVVFDPTGSAATPTTSCTWRSRWSALAWRCTS